MAGDLATSEYYAHPPKLVVGCWQLDDRSWPPHSPADIERALDTYQALGIRDFDTADIYGRSESLLGRFIKNPESRISTKAVFYDYVPTPQQIRHKVENSLKALQRDCLDRVHLHWHDPTLDFAPTLAAYAELVEQGKIQQFGVTNFSTAMLERAVNYAPISTHEVQYSLVDRRVEATMQPYCQAQGIALVAYGALAGGYLSDSFRTVDYPPTEPDHARSFFYSTMIRTHGGWQAVLALLSTLAEVAQAHNKSIAQIALNWVIAQPNLDAVLVGITFDRRRIQANIEALDFQLAPADLMRLRDRSSALFKQPGDIYSYER